MWYKIAKDTKQGAAETIIRRLLEQQIRKRSFLNGDQYLPKEEVKTQVDNIIKNLLSQYGDLDLIRQKVDILDYGEFVKGLVKGKKPQQRKAGVDEENYYYCDICEASEKDGIEIDYNEWENKHLCPDCASNLENERDGFMYGQIVWDSMSPQEREELIRRQ